MNLRAARTKIKILKKNLKENKELVISFNIVMLFLLIKLEI